MPGELTPSLAESLVRLGTWLPFAPAAAMLAYFTGVAVSAATARRRTEQAGAAYVAVQTAAVEELEHTLPPAPAGPAVQLLSVDGALVPLVRREWAEVKTLAIGAVGEPRRTPQGETEVHTSALSYFARLADHETCGQLASVETHRRGTERAGVVCAVSDGADWIQGFVDLQRPDAVRILDWAHAVGYLAQAADAAFGAGSLRAQSWLAQQRHALTHDDPQGVLAALAALRAQVLGANLPLPAEVPSTDTSPGAVITRSLLYLHKRRAQIQYATFAARGYPRGSGSVESANKLVVQARLKGAGMQWERRHVNPLVALRTVACSERWAEAWPQITAHLRAAQATRRRTRAAARLAAAPALDPPPQAPPAVPAPPPPAVPAPRRPGPRRPAPDHPWRRSCLGHRRPA